MRDLHTYFPEDAAAFEAHHAEPDTRLVHGYPVDADPADCAFEPRRPTDRASLAECAAALRAAQERAGVA